MLINCNVHDKSLNNFFHLPHPIILLSVVYFYLRHSIHWCVFIWVLAWWNVRYPLVLSKQDFNILFSFTRSLFRITISDVGIRIVRCDETLAWALSSHARILCTHIIMIYASQYESFKWLSAIDNRRRRHFICTMTTASITKIKNLAVRILLLQCRRPLLSLYYSTNISAILGVCRRVARPST